MRSNLLTRLMFTCLLVLCAVSTFAQAGKPAADPITGKWTGTPPEVVFNLKFDGKGAVSGTVTPQPGTIKKGTFDQKTGALRLEGDGRDPDGAACPFVIEGKVDKGVATGTATCGARKVGDFKMTRQAGEPKK